MERRLHSRLTGVIYVIGAVFGLIISLGGLIVLWSSKAEVTRQVTDTVALVGDVLTATHDTMTVVSVSLEQAGTNLTLVHDMVISVAGTLENSSGLVSSTADLIGTNMVDFVNNTQASLASVQNSAKAVDSILSKINSVPLIGPYLGNGYNPELPLQDSVAKVSKSMDPLPDSLTKIRRDLDVSSANVATVKAEMEVLAKQVDGIQTNLKEARRVAGEYSKILADAQTRYDKFQKDLPVAINTIYMGVTLVLIWIFITQLGMLIHGVELMG